MTLLEILNKKNYKTDKYTTHKYIQEFYENEFTKYKSKKIRLLEIGVLEGESLKLWHDYFQNGEIIGIDIFTRVPLSKVSKSLSNYNIQLFEVDSFNIGNVQERRDKFIKNSKKFDIVIDDGLHSEQAQLQTFTNFSPLVKKGGVYIIEDVRESSIPKLQEIENIQILHLSEGRKSKVKRQAIGVIRF